MILAAAGQDAATDVAAPEVDEAVAALLDSIDVQSESLRGFQSRIRMDSYDDLADETERRFGRVWMMVPESGRPTDRMAAVVFERTVESSGRIRERLEHYVYRDCILSDYDHEARRLVRRRICEPDDPRDPLRLGEGPIPIPIGQRKADIVKSFAATIAETPPNRLVRDPGGVVGLHLVPRAGTKLAQEGDIVAIDYWIRSDDAAPVAVEILESTGDRTGLVFMKPTFDPGLDDEGRRWLEAPEVDAATWRIEEK